MAEQKPMTTKPKAPTFDAAAFEKASAEAKRQHAEVVKQMTDHRLYERVRAFHPHADTGPDALKAMVEDYNRLKADQEKATAGTADKLMTTA
jgi:hypothetical protein